MEATIRLAPKSRDLNVILLAVPEMAKIISILETFRQHVSLTAYEFFSEQALQHVIQHTGGRHPFAEPSAFYALLEYEAGSEKDVDASLLAFHGVCA